MGTEPHTHLSQNELLREGEAREGREGEELTPWVPYTALRT